MKDQFVASRLPDLPNAGYATHREKALTDEIMMFVRGVERNRLLLLTIVSERRDKFRKTTMKAWKHLRVDEALVDAVFGYLALLAGDHVEEQLATLQSMNDARKAGLWIPSN